MRYRSIFLEDGSDYAFRLLGRKDASPLGEYFLSLSDTTRLRFGPHPLTADFAAELCSREDDSADRYLLLEGEAGIVKGYFILEYGMVDHEQDRYREQGVDLEEGRDIFFAPSLHDSVQGRGIASLLMPCLIRDARQRSVRSLVLLGGVRSTNELAVAFYRKFGFVACGGYESDVYNIDMRLSF